MVRVLDQPRIWLIGNDEALHADPLDKLCGPGKALRAEALDAAEFSGLRRSGPARLNDAGSAGPRFGPPH